MDPSTPTQRRSPSCRLKRCARQAENSIRFTTISLRTAFERRNCDWDLGIEEMRGIELSAICWWKSTAPGNRPDDGLRTRLAIAEHRYDDAIEFIRNQYRLGRDVAKMPFLVCGLFGIAISNMANGPLIVLIANRDSPNMYWGLLELPHPLIDMPWEARFEFGNASRRFRHRPCRNDGTRATGVEPALHANRPRVQQSGRQFMGRLKRQGA